jgi:hypothetical protein
VVTISEVLCTNSIFLFMIVICLLIILFINIRVSTSLILQSDKCKMVLFVRDQEEKIEGIIRELYSSKIYKLIGELEKIIVVDMGSSDDTIKILRKMENSYSRLYIMDKEQFIKSITNM